eukprot:CAMPEP_0201551880 /NCGR_PEP_ID=MMETSP0173_2-20130828/11904_1 /ASSEMBLY_ACC=CAM_ASM_000268 /TAXON_ID=218659 /ORGANISM="Vexillifera sp., Strain DIVA3 564/2" /LENGTH=82 /DNA_ID=CAMNT_0047962233 /DNA_START=368 /DNA_END=616 /DNA_ORIENTATION=+
MTYKFEKDQTATHTPKATLEFEYNSLSEQDLNDRLIKCGLSDDGARWDRVQRLVQYTIEKELVDNSEVYGLPLPTGFKHLKA